MARKYQVFINVGRSQFPSKSYFRMIYINFENKPCRYLIKNDPDLEYRNIVNFSSRSPHRRALSNAGDRVRATGSQDRMDRNRILASRG